VDLVQADEARNAEPIGEYTIFLQRKSLTGAMGPDLTTRRSEIWG